MSCASGVFQRCFKRPGVYQHGKGLLVCSSAASSGQASISTGRAGHTAHGNSGNEPGRRNQRTATVGVFLVRVITHIRLESCSERCCEERRSGFSGVINQLQSKVECLEVKNQTKLQGCVSPCARYICGVLNCHTNGKSRFIKICSPM